MSEFRDFSDSGILLTLEHTFESILQDALKVEFKLPTYLFLVGLSNYDCKFEDKSDVQIVKCKKGRTALRFIKNLKGTIVGIVVGNEITDMDTQVFLDKISNLLVKKVVYLEEDCQEMFIENRD